MYLTRNECQTMLDTLNDDKITDILNVDQMKLKIRLRDILKADPLENCVFCGGKMKVIKNLKGKYYLSCDSGFCLFKINFDSREDAIDTYNQRCVALRGRNV